MTIYIDRVDCIHRFAVLTNGDVHDVTNVFDADGDEIDEGDTESEPASAVIKISETKWASVDLRPWLQPTIQ